MIFISKVECSAFPAAGHHRDRGSAAEPVAGQRGQARRLDGARPRAVPAKPTGPAPCPEASVDPTNSRSAQSGSTWTSISMNSWPCPRSFARRRRRARACSPAAAAAAAAAASGSGAFFLAPEPALVLIDVPRPTPSDRRQVGEGGARGTRRRRSRGPGRVVATGADATADAGAEAGADPGADAVLITGALLVVTGRVGRLGRGRNRRRRLRRAESRPGPPARRHRQNRRWRTAAAQARRIATGTPGRPRPRGPPRRRSVPGCRTAAAISPRMDSPEIPPGPCPGSW